MRVGRRVIPILQYEVQLRTFCAISGLRNEIGGVSPQADAGRGGPRFSHDHEIGGRRNLKRFHASKPVRHGVEEEAHSQRQSRVWREERTDRGGLAPPLRQDSNEAARPNVDGDVNPGFHDEATTGERPLMRHLAIVAAQAGRDFQLDCFLAGPTSLQWVSALRYNMHSWCVRSCGTAGAPRLSR